MLFSVLHNVKTGRGFDVVGSMMLAGSDTKITLTSQTQTIIKEPADVETDFYQILTRKTQFLCSCFIATDC